MSLCPIVAVLIQTTLSGTFHVWFFESRDHRLPAFSELDYRDKVP